ncbi:MAG: FkbM family methyltransferase [Planctomycetota bacterium]|nr:FkbM family methyltransferase [Planctomycetota bacterium]
MHNSFGLRIKHLLTPTIAGRWLENAREQMDLWKAMHGQSEKGSLLFQNRCGRILLASLCRPGRVFMDVGAHIGSVIASVNHCVSNARIIAIEADPEKAHWLKATFPSVLIHNCAVGAQEGEVQFDIDLEKPGFSSIASNLKQPREVRSIRVPMHRIDTLYVGTTPVDLIKIDVEGMELAVLQGTANLIARHRPTVYFESALQSNAFGFTCMDLYNWFAERKYQIVIPNRVAHDGVPLSRDGFAEAHHFPQRTLNYFAIPTERRLDIRDRARVILGVRVI